MNVKLLCLKFYMCVKLWYRERAVKLRKPVYGTIKKNKILRNKFNRR